MRPPVVMGLAARCGVTTLAAALHAVDGGRLDPGRPGEVDIVVCRADAASVRQVNALACSPAGPAPIVVLAAAEEAGRVAPRAGFSAVVELPRVGRWYRGEHSPQEVAAVLGLPPEHLTPEVTGYAEGLRGIVSALVVSGLLLRRTPPQVSRPTVRGGLRCA